MRRLDQSLTRLAERGEPAGAEVLLDRIAHQLETGSEGVVVALGARRTDVQTDERPTTTRKRGPWLAAAAFAVVIIAAVAILVVQSRPEESVIAGEPPGVMDEFVAALHDNDAEAVLALVDAPNLGFVPWIVALDTSDTEFTGCTRGPSDLVTCTVTAGPNWFYSRISDDPMVTTFSATVGTEQLSDPEWPPPPALAPAERAFEQWVEEYHPERYNQMFSFITELEHINFSGPSGAARTELADEYLAYLADQG